MNKTSQKAHVVVSKNGPYLVAGSIRLSKQTIGTDAEGDSESWIESNTYPVQDSYALCRCGRSKTKPFCDGTHTKIGFDGTETASREPYESQAKVQDGPEMQLLDAEPLCALARFCDPNGQVWNQVGQTQSSDVRSTFIRQVGNCASGRLVARDRSTQRRTTTAPVHLRTLPSSVFFTYSPGITKTDVPNSGIWFSHSHLKLHTSSWRLPVFALYNAIRSRWLGNWWNRNCSSSTERECDLRTSIIRNSLIFGAISNHVAPRLSRHSLGGAAAFAVGFIITMGQCI
jgi:CDGSH-type Zn-finger protein